MADVAVPRNVRADILRWDRRTDFHRRPCRRHTVSGRCASRHEWRRSVPFKAEYSLLHDGSLLLAPMRVANAETTRTSCEILPAAADLASLEPCRGVSVKGSRSGGRLGRELYEPWIAVRAGARKSMHCDILQLDLDLLARNNHNCLKGQIWTISSLISAPLRRLYGQCRRSAFASSGSQRSKTTAQPGMTSSCGANLSGLNTNS